MDPLCPSCKTTLSPTFVFCPYCGTSLRTTTLSQSLTTQLGIYLLSFFLPPFGLWPAFRYLRRSEWELKRVGLIALGITIISLGLSVVFTQRLLATVTASMQQQLNLYQSL